ncbi:MAG: exonuclease domain-containing protein [Acutalibacteraceae bacterium]
MNFIVFDLECDTVFSKRHGRFINEILEVGAVRLDSKLNKTDEYHCMVRSQVSKKLSKRIIELTGITNEEISATGVGFSEMLEDFERWISKTGDNIFVSWSNSDIHMIVSNLGYFTEYRTIPFIRKYADLQAYVMKKLGIPSGCQISLTDACERLGINEDESSHHRALYDSLMCCEILRKCFNKRDFMQIVLDTEKDKFYERLFFKPYVVKSMKSPFVNKKDFVFKCPGCKKRAKQLTEFRFSGHAFKAEFECPKCGRVFVGNVRIKKTFDDISVNRFTTEPKRKTAASAQQNRERKVKSRRDEASAPKT